MKPCEDGDSGPHPVAFAAVLLTTHSTHSLSRVTQQVAKCMRSMRCKRSCRVL
jgi:hypothetical protein